MKTINKVLIFIMLLVSLSLFMGCSNSGYTYVSSVRFTTNGQTKSFYSYYKKELTWIQRTIEKEEYDASSLADRIYANDLSKKTYITTKAQLPPKSQRGTSYYLEKPAASESTTKYYATFHGSTGEPLYYKYTYSGIGYYYIQVKVINSTTIAIKNQSGETTYTVSSYNITYLN